MSWTTGAMDHLIRSEVWSQELKEVLEDSLMATGYVNWLTDFPDGDQFTIPSIGTQPVRDYTEDTDVIYDKMDTGEFTFQITEYLSSATYITNKAKQDAFYLSQLESKFVPAQQRAIEERLETDILALANQQTASNTNSINGAAHRFVATGGSNGARTMTPADFAKAKFGLRKANVPLSRLVAIVDPSTAYHLETLTNLVNVSNNPMWEGIIADGITTGMRFVKNIYGFDVYESNFLAGSKVASEAIGGSNVSAANGVANVFFSADSSILPFIGAWRQMPKVDSEYNKDKQRDEYVTTARYGVKLYRPENLVVVLTDDNTV